MNLSRIRLSVRALMAVVLVLAVVLGWVVHRAHVQRDAVAAIEWTGGSVRYDWKRLPNGDWDPKGQPQWPRWLIDNLGVDYFGHVVSVGVRRATDAEMEHIGRLGHLEQLGLTECVVTDAGLAHLRGLIRLKSLLLVGNQVTGSALVNLRGMTRLRSLHIRGVTLSDADLVHLEGLTNLENLDLLAVPVGDAGLVHLKGLIGLKQLLLHFTRVRGTGLSHLGGMKRLNRLSLRGSPVDDLSTIPPLPRLIQLSLDETSVDDAQLSSLAKLPALTTLGLHRTKVTDAGLPRLRGLKGRLTGLRLSETLVTDAAAPDLLELEKLAYLYLERTRVTDATLDRLAGLENLQILDVRGTAATDAGIARLRKAFPGLSLAEELHAARRARAKAQAASIAPPKLQGARP